MPPGPDGTVLSDLAATLFAVVLLTLVVLLALPPPGEGAGTAPPAPRPVERAVLTPRAMVALLAARRPGTPGLSLDLREDGLVLTEARGTRPLDGPIAARGERLRAALPAAQGPVRLYVFSARPYAEVLDALGSTAHVEISVPPVLRESAGRGWSPAFLALLDRAASPEAFRDGLAALLAAGPTTPGADRVAGRAGGGTAGGGASAGLGERLRRWLALAAEIAMPMAGLAGVLAIERALRRRPAPVPSPPEPC